MAYPLIYNGSLSKPLILKSSMENFMNSAFYLNNRQQLMEKIGSESVAIFFAAPEATYSHDVHYPYRQESR